MSEKYKGSPTDWKAGLTKKPELQTSTRSDETALALFNDFKNYMPTTVKFKYSNTKAENIAIKNPIRSLFDNPIGINVARKGSKEEHLVNLVIEGDKNVRLPDAFDYTLSQATIISAIGSNYERIKDEQKDKYVSNGIVISLEQLAGLRDGLNEVPKVADETKEELLRDIEILSSIRITLDTTAHMKYNELSKKKSQEVKTKYTGNMLNTEIIELNGETYIHVMRIPVFYQYALDAGQVISFKTHELNLRKDFVFDDIGGIVKESKTPVKVMTNQVRCIRDFVFKEIGLMRGRNLYYRTIKYSTLYNALEEDRTFAGDIKNKATRQRVNNNVTKVLNAMKQKETIEDWNYFPQGRTQYYEFKIFIDTNKT